MTTHDDKPNAPEWPDRIVLMRNPANPDDWRIAADPNMIPCPDDGVYRRADLVPAPVSREAVAEVFAGPEDGEFGDLYDAALAFANRNAP